MPTDQEQLTTSGPVLEFDGTRGSFAKLLIINGLLTILTLGMYRFWAKTKVRRFFWSNTRFLDDPLEYTGTGGELFVGFLIVMAVLFPLGLIYSAINTLVPPDVPAMHIGLEIAYYLVIYALIQIGFYRMWRYRMSRTTWRGVRFGLDGSTWTFLKLSTGWTLLTAITVGLAYPWMQVDLWRYQVRHTRIGSEVFRFEGNGKDLIWAWITVYIPMLFILFAGTAIYLALDTSGEGKLPRIDPGDGTFVATMGGVIGVSYIAFFLAMFCYQIKQTRYLMSGVKLNTANFHSLLPTGRLLLFAVMSLILMGCIILLPLGLHYGLGINTGVIPDFMESEPLSPGLLFGPYIILFVSLFLIFPLLWTIIFRFEVVKQLVITTTIENADVLEQAVQSASDPQRTGEGLADALDIGGF